MEATLPVVMRRTCLVRDSIDLTGNFRGSKEVGNEGETEGGDI